MATIVSKEYAQDVLNAVVGTIYTGDFEVALLKSAPTITNGTLSITGAELSTVTDEGYARITVPVADFSAATGNNPAHLSNDNDLFTEYNTGEDNWQSINYVALISGSKVLMCLQTSAPVSIAPSRRVRIPAGSLVLRMASA